MYIKFLITFNFKIVKLNWSMNCFLFCKSIKFLMEFQSTDSKTEKLQLTALCQIGLMSPNIEIKQP